MILCQMRYLHFHERRRNKQTVSHWCGEDREGLIGLTVGALDKLCSGRQEDVSSRIYSTHIMSNRFNSYLDNRSNRLKWRQRQFYIKMGRKRGNIYYEMTIDRLNYASEITINFHYCFTFGVKYPENTTHSQPLNLNIWI